MLTCILIFIGDETPNRRRRQKSRNEDENANSAFESSASEDSGSERDSITRVCTSPEKAGRSSDACEEMNSILGKSKLPYSDCDDKYKYIFSLFSSFSEIDNLNLLIVFKLP